MTTAKCPKCGSRNFQVIDYYSTPYLYEVTNGTVTADGTGDDTTHVKTICVCRQCKRRWHPRNFEITIDN